MLVLASKSPRRRELLEMIGFDFLSESAPIDEDKISETIQTEYKDVHPYERAEKLTMALAYEKAKACHKDGNKTIGSDTVVVDEDGILEKPKDEKDAKRMLVSLCGKTHRVYTGVSVVSDEKDTTFAEYTEVSFYPYDECMEEIINNYIETKSPMDKAGAYGIQDMGSLMIEKIEGDYYTVMGLPVAKLYRILVSESIL